LYYHLLREPLFLICSGYYKQYGLEKPPHHPPTPFYPNQFLYKTSSSVDGIIKTIDNFRVIGFNHVGNRWDHTTYAGPISEGENYMWGNPIAEMMYETLRYFAGESQTSAFSANVSDGNDLGLDLPLETWEDPYDPVSGFPACAKPIMLVLSDINPSYDTDQLPGSDFAAFSGSLGSFNAKTEADTISSGEGFGSSSEHYIGQSGAYTDSACSSKLVSGLGDIRGLCPEEPTKLGGYYSASVGYYGNKTVLNSESSQTLSTYAVGLASPLPQVNIDMDNNPKTTEITLIPFAKTVYSTGGGGVTPVRGDFQPTCAIVDFYVDAITSTSGRFLVTYEHAEQGSDYDMDALITYEYTKTSDTTLDIKISSMESTYGGGSKQHFGYIISGTDADGVYLEIKNNTQPDDEDRDYYLDTPGSCGPNTGASDLCWEDGTHLPNETMRTFTVGAGSAATLLENPLYYAAKWGGFDDIDGDQEPDQQDEWDKDGDGVPDTYFYVINPLKLEEQLNETFADIARKTSSGTTASVLATNSEGEGHLLQAYFKPHVIEGSGEELNWHGFLQSLWVDPWGNIREDSNQNQQLDLFNTTDTSVATDVDKIILYTSDSSGNTKVTRFTNHHMYHPKNGMNSNCYLDQLTPAVACPDLTSASNYETVGIDQIYPIFEAGERLHQRAADDRTIFTFIDGNASDDDGDGSIDESGESEGTNDWVGTVDDPYAGSAYDGSSEVVAFTESNWETIKPFLGLKDANAWSYIDNPASNSHETRVKNLIAYVRGEDGPDLDGSPNTRSRTKDDGEVWKLGDIINSTPVSVSKPPDYYHLIYGDESFQDYLDANKDRETVVYVGANDGMLHAFTSWKYNDGQYTQPASTSEAIGDELWAYIPQTLLPHLKFLADPEYGHTYYVDLKPKVFDAQINGVWKTLLLVGLNMGGKAIWAEGDFDGNSSTADTIRWFYPTYVCLDVTNPRVPRLLWERSYENLEMSTSYPAIVAVGKSRSTSSSTGTHTWSAGKWLAVFGSGPSEYDGSSSQNGHMFVVDLETGEPYRHVDGAGESHEWLFETGTNYTVMNSPVAFDKNLTYNVDSIYFGSTAKVRVVTTDASDGVTIIDNGLAGKLFKINTHKFVSGVGVPSDDPVADWHMSTLFDSPGPISASVALSTDKLGNVWAFFGTGRYHANSDKTDQTQQYFLGVKDPYFNYDHSYYLSNDTSSAPELGMSDLFNSNLYTVYTSRKVKDTSGAVTGWYDMVDLARGEDGWYRELETTTGYASERVISKATVLGGIVFFPGYTPNNDQCGFGGDTRFYATYYETGTAYYKHIVPGPIDPATVDGESTEKVNIAYEVGLGAPPPAAGFHVGRETGATAYLQMSTGEVKKISVDTAFPIKSGIAAWRDNNN